MAAATAVLTALRDSGGWIEKSTTLKERGADWHRQRAIVRDIAQRIQDSGPPATEAENQELREREARLLVDHPRIPSDLYDVTKREKAQEFDDWFGTAVTH